jgi:NAD(P)-dependent dehydrogenase (short-subunit alcohol dehydrogenase family)
VGSKNDILILIHDFIHSVATERINQAIKSVDDPLDKLYRIIRTEIAVMHELSDAVLLMYRDSRVLEKPFLKKMLGKERGRVAIFEQVLEECISKGLLREVNVRAAANLIKTMAETLVMKRWDMRGFVNSEEMERIILNIFFKGLLKGKQQPLGEDNLRGKSVLIINAEITCGGELNAFLLSKGAKLALYINNDLEDEKASLSTKPEKWKNCKIYLSKDVGPMTSNLLKHIAQDFGPIEIIIHYFGDTATNNILSAGNENKSSFSGFQKNFDCAQELTGYIQKTMSKMSLEKILYLAPCAEDKKINPIRYEATKAALAALTKNMSKNLAASGINVNCVVPGFASKSVQMKREEENNYSRKKELAPLDFLGEKVQFLEIIYFFISGKAKYLNGEILTVSDRND